MLLDIRFCPFLKVGLPYNFKLKRKFSLQEHLSLFDITCVCQVGDKTLALFTHSRSLLMQPIRIRFNGDLEMEAWQADIVSGE